nr:presequence protease, mitochondrial [Leptinotarsa decemlineata]XP_023024279.1 presequence protease, mitochondrial [Leptinotarsa decemlineata]XP_023024280.1 presequence protease, mitochondrial [Leptinotarsa decemlineata]XP_023024281.1 presequence protease, mitochondrial [Leptinotarsa decemlineata]XP_023024283.1 presequence protease, mitochondrial [Leptinotarsa decemlineata]
MWSRNITSYLKPNCARGLQRKYSNIAKTKALQETSDVHSFSLGEKYHGFVVKQIQEIPEFRITAIYMLHEKTQAPYLHLFREDSNNVFSVNFRTTPLNSTGLPHILEHTVLCGSELFPVRDPFFKMLNRSLSTFMNAMTGSDYTMYPFSTQNYSDYKNLQKIYLDAVFRPQLKELDFMQEGWRLEHSDPNNIKSDIVIKGVVFNEMKGVFSENDNILGQKLQNLILPDHTYGVISGGDPKEIPDLTWNDLKKFHLEHYHPSNSRIYSYGNFPLLPSLEYIDSEYFSKYANSPPTHTKVPKQKRWKDPKKEHIPCRFDNMGEPLEKQNSISLSLLLSDNTNVAETFLMQFLTELLIKGPNSPFYKSMIEPNFSGGFTSSTGFDSQPRDCIFTIGLQGVKQEDFEKVTNIFNETIDDVIKNGFEPHHIESVLHRYELSIKHETNNFGLNLLFGITPTWNHSEDVLACLEAAKLMEKLRSDIKNNPKYLQEVVRKYFKDNTHKLTLTMSADKDFEAKLEKAEKELIKKKTKGLSDDDKKAIYEKCQALQKQQAEPAKTELLPTLVIDDINSEVEKVDKVQVTLNNVQTQINKVNSNGIVYFKALINTNELSPEQQMLLPLFCYVINKLGTNKLNYREFDSLMSRKTAGLSFTNHIGESLFHLHTYEPGLFISSYCLEKNCDSMWDIWNQIFNISELKDVQRFQMLVQLYMANLTHGIVDSGHVYAMQAASSLVSGSAYQVELLSGLHHITYMKRLMNTSNYKAMLDEIVNIARILFDKKKMRVALNISPENRSNILHSFENFINKLPEATNTLHPESESTYVTGKVWAPTDAVNCQHHVLNVPINYCSKAILTAPYTHKDYAKLRVLARLLSSKYLHPELRERQGAYGGGARIMPDGVFSFFSYRDPRSLETLDVFDNSYKWIQNEMKNITEQDIFEAKLGVFQAVDAPVPPSSKGSEEFLKRLTPDIKQRHRAELMSVEKDGLKMVAEKYLGLSNVLNSGKVIIGPKNDKVDLGKRDNEMWTVMDTAS